MTPPWLSKLLDARARDLSPAPADRLLAQSRIVQGARRELRGSTPSRLEGSAGA